MVIVFVCLYAISRIDLSTSFSSFEVFAQYELLLSVSCSPVYPSIYPKLSTVYPRLCNDTKNNNGLSPIKVPRTGKDSHASLHSSSTLGHITNPLVLTGFLLLPCCRTESSPYFFRATQIQPRTEVNKHEIEDTISLQRSSQKSNVHRYLTVGLTKNTP